MMDILKPEQRGSANFGWLRTNFLFSFGDYYDPKNMQWGAIRVFNDDLVGPKSGFPPHPHSEMEIITIVLEGAITHQDSMGNKEKVIAGEVQAMTAGEGLQHAEYNLEQTQLHLYQIWIRPSRQNLPPTYGQVKFKEKDWEGKLLAVASGQGKKGAAKINSDSTVYRCLLQKSKKLVHKTSPERHVLVYLTSGNLKLNGKEIGKEWQARVTGEKELLLEAKENSHFVLIDAP